MRTVALSIVLVLLTSCGSDPEDPPMTDEGHCDATWTGAISGMIDCGQSPKVLGIKTASSLNWLAYEEDSENSISFGFQLPLNVEAKTYVGGPDETPSCQASVHSMMPPKAWTALSRGAVTQGSCSITFTEAVLDDSGSTREYLVHGTATAVTVLLADSSTVTLTVSF